jgi:hypothetical protein
MRKLIETIAPIIVVIIVMVIGTSAVLNAGVNTAPEIETTTGVAVAGLLSGAILIIRARRKT